jgi:hypothetical protein
LISSGNSGSFINSYFPIQNDQNDLNNEATIRACIYNNQLSNHKILKFAFAIDNAIGKCYTGKSTRIAQELELLEKNNVNNFSKIRIPINETLTEDFIISMLQNHIESEDNRNKKKLGIHFDVCSHAKFVLFNSLLTDLILGGMILSKKGRGLSFLGLELYIFFELGLSSKIDKKFSKYSDPNEVLLALPIIKHYGEDLRIWERNELIITEDTKLVWKFIFAYNDVPNRNMDINATNFPNATDKIIRDTLDKFFTIGADPRFKDIDIKFKRPQLLHQKSNFVKLLAVRLRHLSEWEVATTKLHEDIKPFFPQIFRIFCDECSFYCQDDLNLSINNSDNDKNNMGLDQQTKKPLPFFSNRYRMIFFIFLLKKMNVLII